MLNAHNTKINYKLSILYKIYNNIYNNEIFLLKMPFVDLLEY